MTDPNNAAHTNPQGPHELDVLAVGAHPDDVELACAGTLLRLRSQGWRLGLLDLSRGELGTRGAPDIRAREAAAAARQLGAEVRLGLELPDGFLANTAEQRMEVVRALRRLRPRMVLMNAPLDRHPDHGNAAELTRESLFLAGLRKIETHWEGQAQLPWRPPLAFHYIQDRQLEPSFLVDVSDWFEQKMEVIRQYQSQFFAPGSDPNAPPTYIATPEFMESLQTRARTLGQRIGVRYAEGFITTRDLHVNLEDLPVPQGLT